MNSGVRHVSGVDAVNLRTERGLMGGIRGLRVLPRAWVYIVSLLLSGLEWRLFTFNTLALLNRSFSSTTP